MWLKTTKGTGSIVCGVLTALYMLFITAAVAFLYIERAEPKNTTLVGKNLLLQGPKNKHGVSETFYVVQLTKDGMTAMLCTKDGVLLYNQYSSDKMVEEWVNPEYIPKQHNNEPFKKSWNKEHGTKIEYTDKNGKQRELTNQLWRGKIRPEKKEDK